MGRNPQLKPKQMAFLAELLAGRTITEAAAKVGISRRTATTWRALPEIIDAIDYAMREGVEAGVVAISGLTRAAVETLERHMTTVNTPPAVQVQAARTVLTTVFDLLHASDVAGRIEELETLLAGRNDDGDDEESE